MVAVHRSGTHSMSKPSQSAITLVAGIGVMGDAHSGATVKHRSRVAKDPQQPNLRQVHLLHAELLDDLARRGFHRTPGEMARTSPPVGSTCWGCRWGRGCAWASGRWWS